MRISQEKRKLLITTYEETNSAKLACEKAGVSYSTFYRYWKKYKSGGWDEVLRNKETAISTISNQELRFSEIELDRFYAIDLFNLVLPEEREALYEVRGKREWVQQVIHNFSSDVREYFNSPTVEQAKYKAPELVEKLTISDRYLKEYGPVVWNVSVNHKSPSFLIRESAIRLHQDGVISMRFCCIEMEEIKDRESWSIDSLISELNILRKDIDEVLYDQLSEFIKVWNEVRLNPKLVIPEFNTFKRRLSAYEVLLFDYRCVDNAKIDIKAMRDFDKLGYLRQLVGLTRMARPFAWKSYSYNYAKNFAERDIGSRDDEYWLLYEERFLRYMPQRYETNVSLWLQDALTALEILLAKKVALEFIVDWTQQQLLLVRQIIGTITSTNEEERNTLIKQARENIVHIYHLTSAVLDPLAIERNVTHSFFRHLLRTFISAQNIANLANAAKQNFDDLHQASQIIEGSIYSQINIELQQLRALQVQTEMERQNIEKVATDARERQNLIIGLVATVLGLGEIISENAAEAFLSFFLCLIKLRPLQQFSSGTIFWTRVGLILFAAPIVMTVIWILTRFLNSRLRRK